MILLPVKDPAESVVVEFVFLEFDGAPSLASVSIAPVGAADPAAAAMLDGVGQIVGASVFQRVKSGLPGVSYKLRCEATRGDDVRVIAAVLPVREA